METFKEILISYSDFYDKKSGDGFNSRYVMATNKIGDFSNGEYIIEGPEIIWSYIDKKGRIYTSTEEPAIRINLI